MRILLLTAIAVIIFTACGAPAEKPASENVKRYPMKGKVISVDREAKKAKIDHEEIPGFMERMTMTFPIHEDWVWDDLKPGSEIRADLVVDSSARDPYWLENIGILAAPDPNNPVETNEKFAQVGQKVPDFTLTGQDGKPVSPKTFAGKAYAMTFIYARCPLADYCIRMSTNFSDAANAINADPAKRAKMALLSISFDPENDTPEKLRSYGLGYLGKDAKDLGVWHLAVGKDAEVRKIADLFGLRYEVDVNDKTQFNHSLRTAVVSADGTITKIFPGNEWTPAQLLKELEAASAK
jgi:protein SCO1